MISTVVGDKVADIVLIVTTDVVAAVAGVLLCLEQIAVIIDQKLGHAAIVVTHGRTDLIITSDVVARIGRVRS